MKMTSSTSVPEYLQRTADALAKYLEKYIPQIDNDPNWWEYRVLSSLPNFAKSTAIKNNFGSLDLASLLKVFDDNWYPLLDVVHLSPNLKNYLKEMRSIRNRWAHQSAAAEIKLQEVERHLSTLECFCQEIDADVSLLSELKSARISIINTIYENVPQPKPLESTAVSNSDKNQAISIGTLVKFKADPRLVAAVIHIAETGDDTQYTVFLNGKTLTWYASQIEVVELPSGVEKIPIRDFNAYLSAKQIDTPNADSLYSLNSAKIDIIPYQFRPVLKFIKSEMPRLLIADSVGVGKTIEAGLILKELEAREAADSILIICPKPLVSERKWIGEMKDRFSESFIHMNGELFRQAVIDMSRGGWDMDEYGKVIIPYSVFTSKNLDKTGRYPGLFNSEYPPEFDLVIVDEAHHIRNSNTERYNAVKYFVEHAKAVVFLTATPIQISEHDLYTLVHLLRPDLIPDEEAFTLVSEPNQYINAAISAIRSQEPDWRKTATNELKKAASTRWGKLVYPPNQKFQDVLKLLSSESISNEERVSLLTDTESFHTFNSVLNRTRSRDIDNYYATRITQTIETPFTPEQKEVYDKILDIQSDILSIIQPNTPAAFMINTLQRRAASCLPGLIPILKDILYHHLSEIDYLESDSYDYDYDNIDFSKLDICNKESIRERVEEVIALANHLPPDDYKYDSLVEILKEKEKQRPNKVMIFSTFRHTLMYLLDRLSQDGFRVGVIHGDIPDVARHDLREQFILDPSEPDALDILLFSEVGCEGLDYQFCDCMVNYDLPWNPMKIEQRIGRIDRTGQKSESVSIFNLITPETVDAVIYNRCLLRIGIFEQAIGGNEEILGKLAKDIADIGENFHLSPEEKEKRLEQLADNLIRTSQEREKLADAESVFFGLPAQLAAKELNEATSFWLSPESMKNLICVYLKKRLKAIGEFILGDEQNMRLRINAEYRAELYKDYRLIPQKPEYYQWNKWLSAKNNDPFYSITFDNKTGNGDLISPVHPLIRQAVAYLSRKDSVSTTFVVNDSEIPEGSYPFAIYMWKYHGLRKTQKLIPVADNPVISEKIMEYFKDGVDTESTETVGDTVLASIEHSQYIMWVKERDEYKQKSIESIRYKRELLRQNHLAHVSRIKETLQNNPDERIRKMKESELHNAENQYSRLVEKLNAAESSSDVESQIVGSGIVIVKRCNA